jgi:hypothetical protein
MSQTKTPSNQRIPIPIAPPVLSKKGLRPVSTYQSESVTSSTSTSPEDRAADILLQMLTGRRISSSPQSNPSVVTNSGSRNSNSDQSTVQSPFLRVQSQSNAQSTAQSRMHGGKNSKNVKNCSNTKNGKQHKKAKPAAAASSSLYKPKAKKGPATAAIKSKSKIAARGRKL